MKFIVNELPYYDEFCPLYLMCSDNANDYKCPRYWDKDKVCSDNNPHECPFLIEEGKMQRGHMTNRWKKWRRLNTNGRFYKFLVLIGLAHSPSL